MQGKGEPTVEQLAAQVEDLRRQGLSMLPRVNAVEILCRTMVAMICSYDFRPDFKDRFEKGIVPAMMKLAREREHQTNQQELSEWLTNQELAILEDHCAKILSDIEAIQASAKRMAQ